MGKGGKEGKGKKASNSNNASGGKGGKGKGNKAKERSNQQPTENRAQAGRERFVGKDYEEAVMDLINGTALQLSDFDTWMEKLLDAIEERQPGKASEACLEVKEALADRAREHFKNPKAYVFGLFTKIKKEIMMSSSKPSGTNDFSFTSSFNADAAEFVPGSPIPVAPSSSFTWKLTAPEFVPSSPSTLTPDLMPSSAPTTPEMVPKGHPYHTPEATKVSIQQAIPIIPSGVVGAASIAKPQVPQVPVFYPTAPYPVQT